MKYNTVIIADGSFPTHEIPLEYIRNAGRIICCDGSAGNLVKFGLEPDAIVGDMDSLDNELYSKYADRIHADDDQETNDLTKAVKWCIKMGFRDIAIVGATGKREDHTIGNISLLAEYAREADVIMVTDTGIFKHYAQSAEIQSFPGQQVSIFSINPLTLIKSEGLKYPLADRRLENWWQGTLNESLADRFKLIFEGGTLLVFLKF
jgi:thiamine pyrophosphokinase